MTDTPTPATAVARPAEPKAEITTGGPIAGMVPQNINQAWRLAQMLAGGGDMIPEVYRNNPQMIMAAIAKGLEVGLAPMQSLATIAVVGGRPMLFGDAIPALLQRAGHHIDVELEGEGDARKAVATLTRSNGKQIVRTFSVNDAKVAKLWQKRTKSGGDTPWITHPDRMLAARARMFAARDGAADALMGFDVGEVSDYGPDRARDVTPSAPRRGGVVYRDPPQTPPVDEVIEHHQPTPDELAAAEAEALAAIHKQAEEE